MCGATVTDKKELGRFSRQASAVYIFLVPQEDEFEEFEGILGVCWVVEGIVWRGLPWCEPIVGKCDWVPCGYSETAGQADMIGLVFPNRVTCSIRSRYG